MYRLWLPLALLACGHQSRDQTPDACTIELVALTPADAAAEVSPDATINATLSRADASAILLLEDAAGQTVPGRSQNKGDTVRFVPDAPLATDTTYTVTLRYCLDTPEPADATASFSSLSTTGPAEGKNYRIDLTAATWVSPVIGGLIAVYLTSDLLFAVTRQTHSTIEIMAATTARLGGSQDACYATIPFPEGSMAEDRAFTLGPASVSLSVTGFQVPVTDMIIEGRFSADQAFVDLTSVSGQISAVDLGATLGALLGTSDPAELCSLFASFGDNCVACADGSSDFCVNVHLSDLYGDEIGGDSVQCIDRDFCHPDCMTSACADPNEGVCD